MQVSTSVNYNVISNKQELILECPEENRYLTCYCSLRYAARSICQLAPRSWKLNH